MATILQVLIPTDALWPVPRMPDWKCVCVLGGVRPPKSQAKYWEENMPDHGLSRLVAEMRAMDWWDQAEGPVSAGENEARRLRRLKILGQIDVMVRQQIEILRAIEQRTVANTSCRKRYRTADK